LGHGSTTAKSSEYTSGRLKGRRFTLASAQQHGYVIGQVHHRGGLHTAVATVDDQVHMVLKQLANLVGVDQRQFVAGHDEGDTHQRLAQILQQGLGDGIIRDAQAHRSPLGMHQAPGDLGGRLEQKGVGTRRVVLQEPIHAVVEAGVGGNFRQVATDQGEIVPVVQAADASNPVQGVLVTDLATEGVGGVGGIHDNSSRAHDIGGLPDQPGLWIVWMYLEKLAHATGSAPPDYLFYNGALSRPRGILALRTVPAISMKQLLEFIPIALFFVIYQLDGETVRLGDWAYTLDGIFSATAVLIVATALQVVISRLMAGYWEKRGLWTFLAVAIFGGATLILRDQTFIQWKPTIFNWALAIAFFAFHFIGDRNLLERTLGAQLELPKRVWARLNILWTGNFAIVGALNLMVAYRFSEATWVSYKLYSAIGFTLLLTVLTALIVSPHLQAAEQASGDAD